jgi:hypothetical protein
MILMNQGRIRARYDDIRIGIIQVLASVEALIDFGEGEEIEDDVSTQGRYLRSYLIDDITGSPFLMKWLVSERELSEIESPIIFLTTEEVRF